jgi:hypothetical protein
MNTIRSTITILIAVWVVGCGTTRPVSRVTHNTLHLTSDNALSILVREVPQNDGNDSPIPHRYNFSSSGFTWTEIGIAMSPIIIAPQATTLYEAKGNNIVTHTYTTPGIIVGGQTASSRGSGTVVFEDVVRIEQVTNLGMHWINLHTRDKKKPFSIGLAKCTPAKLQRITEALLTLCPNSQ